MGENGGWGKDHYFSGKGTNTKQFKEMQFFHMVGGIPSRNIAISLKIVYLLLSRAVVSKHF